MVTKMLASKISTKFQIAFLGVLLLVEYTFGNVIPVRASNQDGNFAIKSACKETIPKGHYEKFEKLSIFTHEELKKFEDNTAELLKNFFDKIIKEGYRDSTLKEKLQPFQKISQELTERQNTQNVAEIIEAEKEAQDLLHKYNETLKTHSTDSEIQFIAEILKRIGLDALTNQINEAGEKLVENFSNKAKEYQNSLTQEERAADKGFDIWYAKLNAALDHGKQIKLFEEFFDLYCTSSNVKAF